MVSDILLFVTWVHKLILIPFTLVLVSSQSPIKNSFHQSKKCVNLIGLLANEMFSIIKEGGRKIEETVFYSKGAPYI